MFVAVLCLILLDVVSISQSATIANCPSSLDRTQLKVLDDTCYQFVLTKSYGFGVAEHYCAQNGGLLAMPKTKKINDFLVSTLHNSFNFNNGVWIGLNDRSTENIFRWVDGTTLMYSSHYTNWADNNGHKADSFFQHGFEDCVYLNPPDGLWHDQHCQNEIILEWFVDYEKPFICEYKVTIPSTTPEPTTTASPSTTACPPFVCDLDCGMTGYIVDPATGCTLCECDG